jgi:pilus assembly protein Flp/PilA
MKTLFARFVKDQSGATAIEYGLIAALMAVVLVTAMQTIGGGITTSFGSIAGHLNSVPAAP